MFSLTQQNHKIADDNSLGLPFSGLDLKILLTFWRILSDQNKLEDPLNFYKCVKISELNNKKLHDYFQRLNAALPFELQVFHLGNMEFHDLEIVHSAAQSLNTNLDDLTDFEFQAYEEYGLIDNNDYTVIGYKDELLEGFDSVYIQDYFYLPKSLKFAACYSQENIRFVTAAKIANFMQNLDLKFHRFDKFLYITNISEFLGNSQIFDSACISLSDIAGLDKAEQSHFAENVFNIIENVDFTVIYYADEILENKTVGFLKSIKEKIFEYNVTTICFYNREIFIDKLAKVSSEIEAPDLHLKNNSDYITKDEIIENHYVLNLKIYEAPRNLSENFSAKLKDFVNIIRVQPISFKQSNNTRRYPENNIEGRQNSIRWNVREQYSKAKQLTTSENSWEYIGGNKFYIVKTEQLTDYGFISDFSNAFTYEDIQSKKPNKLHMLKPYDILFSYKGKIGEVGIVGEDVARSEVYPDQAILILRIRQKLDYKKAVALYMFLKSPAACEYIANITMIGNVNILNVKAFESMPIPAFSEKDCQYAFDKLEKIIELDRQIHKLDSKKNKIIASLYDYL
ncbi:restriction endonuclease subunit S domain-containing protein [Geovibrio ferrireducens]|uniref:hypothetical protein n=1 Tax=Geovibrio ferrireducens TaxID=46201 RepID=UPI002246A201|nr:hypothetical protein [Geovibrio ferrireducens]